MTDLLNMVLADAESGRKFKFSLAEIIDPVVAPEPEPEPLLEPEPAPAPAPTPTVSAIPILRSHPRFADNVSSAAVILPNGGTLSKKNILVPGQQASVQCNGSAVIRDCIVASNEGVRIGGAGTILIDGCHLSAKATSSKDHADTVQVYSPYSEVHVTVSNSLVEAFKEYATAGLFSADYACGSFTFDNVVFKGGPFGLRINRDGKPISVSLKNVFFVGPFGWDRFLLQENSGPIEITAWEEVWEATIDAGGKLIRVKAIPRPGA